MSVAVEPSPIPLTLSTNLVSALNNPRGALRTVAQRDGTIVTVYAGGEVDAANEHSWHQLLREAAAATPPPGPLLIDTDGLDFMGCCAFTALAEEADRCRSRDQDRAPRDGDRLHDKAFIHAPCSGRRTILTAPRQGLR